MTKPAGQPQLTSLEDKKDSLLSKLAAEYAKVRDERMDLTAKEVERRDTLAMKMREKGLAFYQCPETGVEVQLESIDKVKVRMPKSEDDEGEEKDGEKFPHG